jgi:hypothetical protein
MQIIGASRWLEASALLLKLSTDATIPSAASIGFDIYFLKTFISLFRFV